MPCCYIYTFVYEGCGFPKHEIPYEMCCQNCYYGGSRHLKAEITTHRFIVREKCPECTYRQTLHAVPCTRASEEVMRLGMLSPDQYHEIHRLYQNLEKDRKMNDLDEMSWKCYLEKIMENQGYERLSTIDIKWLLHTLGAMEIILGSPIGDARPWFIQHTIMNQLWQIMYAYLDSKVSRAPPPDPKWSWCTPVAIERLENKDCSICRETYGVEVPKSPVAGSQRTTRIPIPFRVPCEYRHVFCSTCIIKLLNTSEYGQNRKCPLCRTALLGNRDPCKWIVFMRQHEPTGKSIDNTTAQEWENDINGWFHNRLRQEEVLGNDPKRIAQNLPPSKFADFMRVWSFYQHHDIREQQNQVQVETQQQEIRESGQMHQHARADRGFQITRVVADAQPRLERNALAADLTSFQRALETVHRPERSRDIRGNFGRETYPRRPPLVRNSSGINSGEGIHHISAEPDSEADSHSHNAPQPALQPALQETLHLNARGSQNSPYLRAPIRYLTASVRRIRQLEARINQLRRESEGLREEIRRLQ